MFCQPFNRKDQQHRLQHYKGYEQQLWNRVSNEVQNISKFEKQNPANSINLFGYEEKELFPVYITDQKKKQHVNLLLISKNNTTIINLSRRLAQLTKYKCKKFLCDYCLHGLKRLRQDLLEQYEPHCRKKAEN